MKPSVKVDNTQSAGPSQAGQAGPHNSWTDGLRKPQAPESMKADQPEGFLQHRLKRESLRNEAHRQSLRTEQTAGNSTKREPHLHRPRSWNEQYGTPRDNTETRPSSRPPTGGHKDQGPMYGNSGYTQSPCTPSPHQWAQKWPFFPEKPGTSSERPPYWAIPSSLPPPKQPLPEAPKKTERSSIPIISAGNDPFTITADETYHHSFKFPTNEA